MVVTWSEHVALFGAAKALPVFRRAFEAIERKISDMNQQPGATNQLRRSYAAVLGRIAAPYRPRQVSTSSSAW